jgi:hypothetical protein
MQIKAGERPSTMRSTLAALQAPPDRADIARKRAPRLGRKYTERTIVSFAVRMKNSTAQLVKSRPRYWSSLLAAAAVAGVVQGAQASQSLGCNGSLVGKGDSPLSLLQKCGEPVYRQNVCVSMLQLGWVVIPYRPGGPSAVLANQCAPMEEWTYNRGPGAFLGVVRIYNGVIESVRDGDRSQ